MHNRAEIIDLNFTKFVQGNALPKVKATLSSGDLPIPPEELVELFESQVTSRHLDLAAREMKARGESYYTIGSSGHESNAAVAKALRITDPAFLHYRSGGFFIQRSKQLPGSTPIFDILLSLAASKEDPISGGRHKVFGSKPLNIPPQTSTIASHLPKAVGAAFSIPRGADLQIDTNFASDSIVLVSFGDASANHSTALGAINTACLCAYQHIPMPIIFLCEDNQIGISVPTPESWVHDNFSTKPSLKYLQCDGLDILSTYVTASEAVTYARERKRPVFLHMKTIRLMGHAGSDFELAYRNLKEIESMEKQDPLLHTAALLIGSNTLDSNQVLGIYESIRKAIRGTIHDVILRPKLLEPDEIRSSISPPSLKRSSRKPTEKVVRDKVFGREIALMAQPAHMAKHLNWALTDLMLQYPKIVLFGEDIAKKGGVYHVTAGLMERFGRSRVFNSPLDEQSILGTAIGMAQNGFLPIPEIQFLAYLHNAEDQIRGEAATLSFFSQGQYTNPMVIRIAGLAYQKGFGGHFHNDNSIAVLRDIPGVIVACPSNPKDAGLMLAECVRLADEEQAVVVFIEPIALYMTKDLTQQGDGLFNAKYEGLDKCISFGEIAVEHDKESQIAIITYGNGTYLSKCAALELGASWQNKVNIIDIRWLSPLPWKQIKQAVRRSQKLLIIEECRVTGSLSEQIAQKILLDPDLRSLPTRLVAAHDCFIPLGKAATSGLPSKESILQEIKIFLNED